MERCDFGSIMTIIRRYISEDKGMNQIDFTYLLFDTFMCSDEAIDFDFDNGQVCRWITGYIYFRAKKTGTNLFLFSR